tara:strand:- start:137 stop:379 length:243 start_codon:yes stop_codon:yes gene_type:complete
MNRLERKIHRLESNMYCISQGITELKLDINKLDRDCLAHLYDSQEIPETTSSDYSTQELKDLVMKDYGIEYFYLNNKGEE